MGQLTLKDFEPTLTQRAIGLLYDIVYGRKFRSRGNIFVEKLVNATGDQVLEAYLYGSTVKGVVDPTSDVDIAIIVKEKTSVRKKAEDIRHKMMTELSSPRNGSFGIDYHLHTTEELKEDPTILEELGPKKLIYKSKK